MLVMSAAHKTSPARTQYAIAVLTVALSSQDNIDLIQLFPAGQFRSSDGSGRPEDVPFWQMDAQIAAHLIQQFQERGQPIVIDYEHQTLSAETNGQPAPAAGWIKGLIWREGQGLFAEVTWTARARAHIGADEYLYISPVFPYDEAGRPLAVLPAALTNNPALTGMAQVRLAAARAQHVIPFNSPPGEPGRPAASLLNRNDTMTEELRALLAALLGLPESATEQEILAALPGFAEKLTADQEKLAELTAKEDELANLTATEDELTKLSGEADELKKELAALRAGRIDPSKYVPAAALADLQRRVNQMADEQTDRTVDEIVTAALSAKKLTPALEPWARDLGKKDIAALRAYVGAAAPIAALSGHQSAALQIGTGHDAQTLSDAEVAICRATGIEPSQYVKHRA